MIYQDTIVKSPLKSTKEILLQKTLNEIVFGPLTIEKIIPTLTEYYFEEDLYKILYHTENHKWNILKLSNFWAKEIPLINKNIVGIPITINLIIRAIKIKYKHLISNDSVKICCDENNNINVKFMRYDITFFHFDDNSLCLAGNMDILFELFELPKYEYKFKNV